MAPYGTEALDENAASLLVVDNAVGSKVSSFLDGVIQVGREQSPWIGLDRSTVMAHLTVSTGAGMPVPLARMSSLICRAISSADRLLILPNLSDSGFL
jgi:hypothetical protein